MAAHMLPHMAAHVCAGMLSCVHVHIHRHAHARSCTCGRGVGRLTILFSRSLFRLQESRLKPLLKRAYLANGDEACGMMINGAISSMFTGCMACGLRTAASGLQQPMKPTFKNFWLPYAHLLCDDVGLVLAEDLLGETIVILLPERHCRYMSKYQLTDEGLPARDKKNKTPIPTAFPCPCVSQGMQCHLPSYA